MSRTPFPVLLLIAMAACGNAGPSLTTEWGLSTSRDVPPAGTDPGPAHDAPDVPPGRDLVLPDFGTPDDGPTADVAFEVPAGDEGPGDTGAPDDGPPPTCAEGDARTVPCGLNGRGVLGQACEDGDWRDQGECQDPDECVDEASAQAACGLNGRGVRTDRCAIGHWMQGPCDDPDECVDDDERKVDCGLNGRGVRLDRCAIGHWMQGGCDDPDECVDGAEQLVACGKNDAGLRRDRCPKGAWVPGPTCVLPGRWTCSQNACKAVLGDPACGDGKCVPTNGESPQSCPADCGARATMDGEGQPCGSAWDCMFYPWTATGPGYWECGGLFNRSCSAVVTKLYCGTVGFDYCYLQNGGVETPASCPQDCQKKSLNCGSAVECVYLDWPQP